MAEFIEISNNNLSARDVCPEDLTHKWTTALATPPITKGKKYVEISLDVTCASSLNTIKVFLSIASNQWRICSLLIPLLFKVTFGANDRVLLG